MRKEVIYNLLEQLDEDGSHTVLMELIKWLDAATIEQFTEDFKRLHNIEEDSIGVDDWDEDSGRPAHMRDEDWD